MAMLDAPAIQPMGPTRGSFADRVASSASSFWPCWVSGWSPASHAGLPGGEILESLCPVLPRRAAHRLDDRSWRALPDWSLPTPALCVVGAFGVTADRLLGHRCSDTRCERLGRSGVFVRYGVDQGDSGHRSDRHPMPPADVHECFRDGDPGVRLRGAPRLGARQSAGDRWLGAVRRPLRHAPVQVAAR